ncbi:hypothetical protein D3C78_1781360 [compost metagenome]
MEHRIEAVGAEQRVQVLGVGDVEFDQCPAQHRAAVARGKVVRHHQFVSRAKQLLDHVRTDVACAAYHQEFHAALLDIDAVSARGGRPVL